MKKLQRQRKTNKIKIRIVQQDQHHIIPYHAARKFHHTVRNNNDHYTRYYASSGHNYFIQIISHYMILYSVLHLSERPLLFLFHTTSFLPRLLFRRNFPKNTCIPDRADDDLQASADEARDPRDGGCLLRRGEAFQVRGPDRDALQYKEESAQILTKLECTCEKKPNHSL